MAEQIDEPYVPPRQKRFQRAQNWKRQEQQQGSGRRCYQTRYRQPHLAAGLERKQQVPDNSVLIRKAQEHQKYQNELLQAKKALQTGLPDPFAGLETEAKAIGSRPTGVARPQIQIYWLQMTLKGT
jgi:hypothetical protein